MAEAHDGSFTWEQFLQALEKEFKAHHQPMPKITESTRYTDLCYTVRVKVVAEVTKAAGAMMNKDDFNKVVVGRLTVQTAFEFIRNHIEANRPSVKPPQREPQMDYGIPEAFFRGRPPRPNEPFRF